jgi:hypothetical protein
MHVFGSEGWFLHTSRTLDLQLHAPERVRGSLYESMPGGGDSAQLRRLMTEMQMLLHEHPLNLARERRGEPAINGVWPWGAGEVSEVRGADAQLPVAFGDACYLRGVWHTLGAGVEPVPANADELLRQMRQDALVLLQMGTVDEFEAWLRPLQAALWRGTMHELRVYGEDLQVSVRRCGLLRFWRSRRPLPEPV